jgi:hypothetical protein
LAEQSKSSYGTSWIENKNAPQGRLGIALCRKRQASIKSPQRDEQDINMLFTGEEMSFPIDLPHLKLMIISLQSH